MPFFRETLPVIGRLHQERELMFLPSCNVLCSSGMWSEISVIFAYIFVCFDSFMSQSTLFSVMSGRLFLD